MHACVLRVCACVRACVRACVCVCCKVPCAPISCARLSAVQILCFGLVYYQIELPLFLSECNAFDIQNKCLENKEEVSQRQGEQTHVDSFLQTLLVEHRHVQDVGRSTNQKQDGHNHSVLPPTDQVLSLGADDVGWVVPGQEVLVVKLQATRGSR